MKRRLIAGLLCLAMTLTLLPILPTYAFGDDDFVVTSNGEGVTSVSVRKFEQKDDKVTLSADGLEADSYQWQIRVTDELWVDINGAEGKTLDVTYAVVANLLNEAGVAYVRCKASASNETVFTSAVAVAIDESVSDLAVEAGESQKPVILSGTQVEDKTEDEYITLLEAYYDAEEALEEAEDTEAEAKKALSDAETKLDEAKRVAEAAETAAAEAAEAAAQEDASEELIAAAQNADAAAVQAREELAAAQKAYDDALLESNNAVSALTQAQADFGAAEEALVAYGNGNGGIMSFALENDENTTYNIVINYLFENNEIAADPYTANLAAGSSFSVTVTFPVIQGYLPYVNDEQKDSIDLNYTAIDKDDTINVVYKPTNVNYTVIHYQQNLDDDYYTEAERETKQGLTNSTVPEVSKTYEGFYALLYEKPAIAADGSTVVEVYYDRYYYLMNFDLGGGYGVEPIYARYGAPIGNVGTPKLAGYSFQGWSLDGTNVVALPTTMPAENQTYQAVWQPDDTAKVTVVFWGENADDEAYSYIKSSVINVKPGTEFTYSESGSLICALKEHTHSFNDCYELTCTQEEHTHSESCYTCGIENHTHSTACYAGVGSASSAGFGAPSNPSNGYVYREALSFDGKVIYINGTWYQYSGSTVTGNIAPTTCGKTENTHTHTDACLGCGKTEHTHSVENNCYYLTCTKTEHAHTSDCYMNGAGLDSNLWTFVKSDTVTVAADGSSVVNVYYDRTMFTLRFRKTNSNSDDYGTIYEKWGANIRTKFNQKSDNAGTALWSSTRNGNDPWTSFLDEMPSEDRIYYANSGSGTKQTATYYGESLDGNGYVVLYTSSAVYNGTLSVSDEDKVPIKGFTYERVTGQQTWQGGIMFDGAEFYYTRNSYTLTFNDGYSDVKTESVKYEAPLSTYSAYVPAVPSAYEPGSVEFGGWYLNPECTGAEYNLNEHTMPADNVLLYAKWVPVTHTVQFYLDKDALDAGTKLSTHSDITVPHGSNADPTPTDPENGSYTFVGWFYMEDGVEKAFDFENMPVTKDLQVYGKWSSNVLKEYTIYYKYKDASGVEIEIAAPTTGSGLAGITKTFEAKGGTELYADYQEGYFPVTKSHSMTLDINATEENDTNVYTFWYVQKEAVPYTVKYLNKETGEPVATEKTVSDNRKAVVTETFVPVSGMMPDAYQKRLVVSAEDGAVNEIIFYYVEDTVHAYYKITHYTENLGVDAAGNPTWTEYASSQAVGTIGETYSADPMTIPGFTYDSTVTGTVASGELTSNGLELKLYYTRNSYPYQVRYLEQGTNKVLHDPKVGTGKYGQVISESAIDITDYDAVAPTSQTLTIRIEEGTEAALNIITFYYKEKEVTINYKMVGPDGTVSTSTSESYGIITSGSETLKVLTGSAQGSTAAVASDEYRFVGWFKDVDCTQPVADADGTIADNKFTPAKVGGKNVAATYYAKFEMNYTTLKISKSVDSTYDANDVFIFDVVGPDGVSFSVTLKAGESKEITKVKVGASYTVTERTGWSSRYTVDGSAAQTKTLSSTASDNEFAFTNKISEGKWLTASGMVNNTFNAVTNTQAGD